MLCFLKGFLNYSDSTGFLEEKSRTSSKGSSVKGGGKIPSDSLKSGKKVSLDSLKSGGKASFNTPIGSGLSSFCLLGLLCLLRDDCNSVGSEFMSKILW